MKVKADQLQAQQVQREADRGWSSSTSVSTKCSMFPQFMRPWQDVVALTKNIKDCADWIIACAFLLTVNTETHTYHPDLKLKTWSHLIACACTNLRNTTLDQLILLTSSLSTQVLACNEVLVFQHQELATACQELDQQMDSSLKQRQDENAEYKEAGHLRSECCKLYRCTRL